MAKVLYVYDGKMTFTGIDAVVRRQLAALSDCTVDLVARGEAGLEHVRSHGSRFTSANLISWLPRSFYYPTQKRLASRRGAKLLHGHERVISWPQRALATFKAARDRGIPCFLNHDTMHFSRSMRAERKLFWPQYRRHELQAEYDLATKILVPSEYSLSTFLKAGVDPAKLVVIGRGVDTQLFHPTLTESKRPFRLLFCGRVSERKGIRQIVDAWKAAALPDAELVIIGTVAKDVEDLFHEPLPNVRLCGYQTNPAPLMQSCDAQIMLSRHEGMAKSLLEGAACGLATLATEHCGFPLQDGVNGFLLSRSEKSKTVDAIRLLHADRDQCRQMGLAGRSRIEADFSWESFARRFREALGLTANS